MKLRSAQFVLLVLLFSAFGLPEGSSLHLAGELVGSGSDSGILLSQRAAVQGTLEARPFPSTALPILPQELSPTHRESLRRAWTMPHPAAQATFLQATSTNARA